MVSERGLSAHHLQQLGWTEGSQAERSPGHGSAKRQLHEARL